MSPSPVRRYREPGYPTRLAVLDDPGLLARHLPPAWLRCAATAGAAAVLLAAGNSALAGEAKRAPDPKAAAIVAPIFEHGEGRGATGCVVANPPAFLSEEEALQVIKEELAKGGVQLSQEGVVLETVRISPRYERGKKVGDKWVEEIVEEPERAKPLRLDAVDPKSHVAAEFVSAKEYYELGGTGSGSSVNDYDFKGVAKSLSERVKGGAKGLYFGAFYDPALSPNVQKLFSEDEELKKLQAKPSKERSQEERDRAQQRYNEIWKKAHAEGRAESQKLLREQVKDFVDWLKAQGAI